MMEALRSRRRGTPSSQVETLLAPVGGWNTRDPLAAMEATDALWLENWWPAEAGVSFRGGAKVWSDELPGAVLSFLVYEAPGVSRLFAATETDLLDVSLAAPGGSFQRKVLQGSFRSTHFTTIGGNFLIAVNGADPCLRYDGTDWTELSASTSPALTGVDSTKFVDVCTFKRRLWFVEKGTTSAWYLPVNSIAGEAKEFAVGQLFSRGGELLTMFSWTLDGGEGPEDYLVFLSSQGEAVVYAGVDPDTVNSFRLVGTFFIGRPIGRDCWVRLGGDVGIATVQGLFPLSKILLTATVNASAAISDKIAPTFADYSKRFGQFAGWGLVTSPSRAMLLVNVPLESKGQARQLALNTRTGAWTLFTGWAANCWVEWQGELYFGQQGRVAKAFQGTYDFGVPVPVRARTSFNYFRSRGQKHFKLVRPVLQLDTPLRFQYLLDINFSDKGFPAPSAVSPAPATPASLWDSAVWDSAVWGGQVTSQADWATVANNSGFCAALRLQAFPETSTLTWSATDFLYQKGGLL